MKKKRMVSVEEGAVISEEEFEDLYTHARNSGIWYATNLPKTTLEIKKKLYEKGYPEGEVTVAYDTGEKRDINIVDTAVESLVEAMFLDDLDYAERYAESKKNHRYGRNKVATDLSLKGIDPETVEDILDKVYGEGPEDELYAFVEKLYAAEAPRATDPWKLKQKLVRRAAARGFDVGATFDVVDEVMKDYLRD